LQLRHTGLNDVPAPINAWFDSGPPIRNHVIKRRRVAMSGTHYSRLMIDDSRLGLVGQTNYLAPLL
jgi:hypothetical protein